VILSCVPPKCVLINGYKLHVVVSMSRCLSAGCDCSMCWYSPYFKYYFNILISCRSPVTTDIARVYINISYTYFSISIIKVEA
jgi:hypothetical protein